MTGTVIHFFLAVVGSVGSPLTSIFFDRNISKRASFASRLNVALTSVELLIPCTEAVFGKPGTTGTSFGVRLASDVGDRSTNSLVNFCGLRETGAGEAELETLGLSSKDFRTAL